MVIPAAAGISRQCRPFPLGAWGCFAGFGLVAGRGSDSPGAAGGSDREDEFPDLHNRIQGCRRGRVGGHEGGGLAVVFVHLHRAALGAVEIGEAVLPGMFDIGVRRALDDDHRRQVGGLAAVEQRAGVALRHVGLGRETGIVGGDQALVAGVAHHAVARQRIEDRPAGDEEIDARIGVAEGRIRRRPARVGGTQRDQPQLLRAARRAEPADGRGIHAEGSGIGLEPADAVADVVDHSRILRRVRQAEIEREDADAVGREVFVDDLVVQPVAGAPGAAVNVDDPARRVAVGAAAGGAVEPGLQRVAVDRAIGDVFEVSHGRSRFGAEKRTLFVAE